MPSITPLIRVVWCLSLAVVFISEANGQAVESKSELKGGLTVQSVSPITIHPKQLRVVLRIKAEEASPILAAERLVKHLELVEKTLLGMGAIQGSIEHSDLKTGLAKATQSLMQVMQNTNSDFRGVGIFDEDGPFVGGALPAFAVVPQNVAPRGKADDKFEIPKIYVATSFTSADWDVSKVTKSSITMLRLKLESEIQKNHLEGSLLTHSYTAEQEDEIFEHTKVDLRNQMQSTPWSQSNGADTQSSLRISFIGKYSDEEYATTLKNAFQFADKNAKQIAVAGNLKLGKVDSVSTSIEVTSPPSVSSSINYNPYPVSYAYPGITSSEPSWEPIPKAGDIKMDSLAQTQQVVRLSVRYQLD